MAEVARTPIGPNADLPTQRTLDERLMVRWPGAWGALSRVSQLMSPRSRLRRALVRRPALSGWGAWVRGDLDLCLVRFAPAYHYDPPREWLIAGMPSVYRGHAGLRQWAADLHEAWEFLDHTPLEVVDAGDVLAFLCRIRLRARASGIELDSHLGQVFWVERGLNVRERDFSNWDDALRLIASLRQRKTAAEATRSLPRPNRAAASREEQPVASTAAGTVVAANWTLPVRERGPNR